jgi:ABC-type Zn uptake system ZnuABC Zn-binding protein ZnuA
MVIGLIITAIAPLPVMMNSFATTIPFLPNPSIAPLAITMNSLTAGNNNSNSGNTNIKKLNVVTSVAPVADIVKNIAGDKIELTQLIPDGVDSHTFELTPSGAIKVQGADLIIINGLHLESGVEKIANASRSHNSNQQLLKLADNTINKNQWIFDFSFPKENGDANPHLWLNVAYAMNYATLIKNKLIQMDPQNAAYYAANTERYMASLNKLDDGIKKSIKTIPPENRKLLTYHDSWAYFAPRYGMTVIGAVQPSDFGEPTPQDVAKLIDQIRNEKVPALFGSEVFPSKVMDQIGKEGHVKYVTTLADDVLPGKGGDKEHSYVGMMLEDTKNMIIALGGNTSVIDGVDSRIFTHVGDQHN